MKKLLLFLILVSLFSFTCSSHKLAEHNFYDHTLTAHTFFPPHAGVFTDPDLYINFDDPVGTLLNLGTTVVREAEAIKARKKLDSAAQIINVPDILQHEICLRSAEVLECKPIRERKNADYVMNIDIKHYGIDAASWRAGTQFIVNAKVDLLGPDRKRIWKKHIEEEIPVTANFFGIGGYDLETVLDAAALSKLSVDEMAAGLENIAFAAADRFAEILYRDYIRSRD